MIAQVFLDIIVMSTSTNRKCFKVMLISRSPLKVSVSNTCKFNERLRLFGSLTHSKVIYFIHFCYTAGDNYILTHGKERIDAQYTHVLLTLGNRLNNGPTASSTTNRTVDDTYVAICKR